MWRQAAGALIIVLAARALAQEDAPQGFLRGDLIRWQGAADQGQFTFLVWPDHVYSCSYDDRTYVERDKQRVTMGGLAKGDHLEVVADRQAGSAQCYARAIQIQPQFLPGANVRGRDVFAAESLAFTLSGAVSSITPELLILRLRSGAHKVIRLRPETRYIQDGQATDRSALAGNRVVFIRATKDLHGETEASQVIWGEILQPRP